MLTIHMQNNSYYVCCDENPQLFWIMPLYSFVWVILSLWPVLFVYNTLFRCYINISPEEE